MFWKKQKTLNSEEFIELKQEFQKLKVQVTSLQIDLELYVRKLKASKGLGKKEEDTETENYKNNVIVPI